MSTEASDTLLAELSKELGLPSLAFNENRVCRLVFDGSRVIDLERDVTGERLTVYSTLGPEPAPAVCRDLLVDCGTVCREANGAALALDVERSEIVLCQTLALDQIDAPRLAQLLTVVLKTAERWSSRLQDGPGEVQAIGQGTTWTRV